MVEIAQTPYGRGLRARVPVSAGEVFVAVPNLLSLNSNRALKSPVGPVLRQLAANYSFQYPDMLAVFLTNQLLLGRRSFWAPYFEMLSAPLMVPLYWSPSDLALLRLSPSLWPYYENWFNVTARREAVMVDRVFPAFPLLFPPPQPPRRRLRDVWRYAVSLVFSRCWSHESYAEMVPFLDLLNHADDANPVAQLHDPTHSRGLRMGLGVQSHRRYGPGEQLLLSYESPSAAHRRCNSELLWFFGFTLGNGDPLRDCLRLSVTESTVAAAMAMAVAGTAPTADDGDRVMLTRVKRVLLREHAAPLPLSVTLQGNSSHSLLPPRLLRLLRILAITSPQQLSLLPRALQQPGQPISAHNEATALTLFRSLLLLPALRKFAPKERYWRAMASCKHTPANARNVARIVLGEARTIRRALEMTSQREEQLAATAIAVPSQ